MLPKNFFKNSEISKIIACDKTVCLEEMEKECLRKILGNCLFTEFQKQFKSDGVTLIDGVDEHWTWLLYGHDFEIDTSNNCGCGCSCDCNLVHWRGLIDGCKSIVALCMEYKIMCDYSDKVLPTGNKNTGNITYVKRTLHYTLIDLQNEFTVWNNVDQTHQLSLHSFINNFKDFFKDFQGVKPRLLTYY